MRNPLRFICILVLGFLGCREADNISGEVAKIEVAVEVARFDREFAQARSEDLPQLKKKYPYLFPASYTDSVWEAKLKDTLQIEISGEVQKVFPDFEEEEKEIRSLYQHIKYYFPDMVLPKVVTVVSDVEYKNRVILADTLLLVGIDNYLGADHKFYQRISKYIADDLDKKFLVRDIATAMANKKVPTPRDRAFLSQMISYGKELYLKEKWMPQVSDDINIGYTPQQLQWAQANEEQMWRYFIENDLLYSNDSNLASRFLEPAPFSKFQLELDNESSDMAGRFIGWQVVRAFMAHNEVDLKTMLALPEEEIFKQAQYKPKKF